MQLLQDIATAIVIMVGGLFALSVLLAAALFVKILRDDDDD